MSQEYKSRPRDVAAEKIEYYIIQNNLQPHQKLLSERDMCKLWNINRTTLRSAIHRLIIKGKLYNKLGSGTFIAPPKVERNLQDLKTLNVVADEHGMKITTKVLSCKKMVANKNVSKKLHIMLGTDVFELCRLRSFDGQGAIYETTYVSADRFPGIENCDFENHGFYQVLEKEFQCDPFEGQEKIAITYSDSRESELLEIPEGTPVIYQSGVVSDSEGVPIEFFKAIVRSDLICFTSKLTR